MTHSFALPLRYPKARVVWIGMVAGATCFLLILGASFVMRKMGFAQTEAARQRTINMATTVDVIRQNLDTILVDVDSIKRDVRSLRKPNH